MNPGLIDKIREARRALLAEGEADTMDNVIARLGKGSKTTMTHYWSVTNPRDALPETSTMTTAVLEESPESMEEEQTEEAKYHADIARLEAAVRRAEDRYDQAEQALWTQAQHYAKVQAIDAAGGFRLARYAQPDRWTNTPKTEKEAMERRIEARADALADIEKARAAITQRQAQWRAACWEAAFLATPEAQFITRNLEETLAALEAAKASNQSDMVDVLARRRASLEKQLDAARRERHLSEEREMVRQVSLAAQEADHRAREKRSV